MDFNSKGNSFTSKVFFRKDAKILPQILLDDKKEKKLYKSNYKQRNPRTTPT